MERLGKGNCRRRFAGAELRREGAALEARLAYEGAYGTGERFCAFNLKGRRIVSKVEEKFCFQGDLSYCPSPFFWTDSGFGLYVDTCESCVFDFRQDRILVEAPPEADMVLFSGAPGEIVSAYMGLFGEPVLPPEWVFGVWASANRWKSQDDVRRLLANLKRLRFPCSVVVLEAWSDEATFYIWNGARYAPAEGGRALGEEDFDFSGSPWPDPRRMIDDIHRSGARLLLWQIPVWKAQGAGEVPNRQNILDRADAVERGLCVRTADGAPYTIPEGRWFAGSMIPDFSNPETMASWFAKRRYLLEMGVDGFKTDGGEFICSDSVVLSDGTDGRKAANRYCRDYEESYQDFIGKGRTLFSRAGYPGQHLTPCHWAGDQQSLNSELRSVLNAGLSAAASGIVFWGFDIGGFAGPPPSLDLYRRATQMACFCPIMQWHSEPEGGQYKDLFPQVAGNNERSPWNIAAIHDDPAFLDEMRFWHDLRERLRPYLWLSARKCVAGRKPLMRPLVMEWPDDPMCRRCDDEFMLGDSLLVAPYLEEDASGRQVLLPRGQWRDFFTGEVRKGGRTIAAGTRERLPVFVRGTASLPGFS